MSQIFSQDDIDFKKYMAESEPQVKVLPADTWREALLKQAESGDTVFGAKLPWSKTHDHIRFRAGEVTVWQGINGHGKSEMLGQACIGFANQGEPVCIASFEMKPQSTLRRMLRQTSMNERPSEAAINQLFDWSRNKIWIYDQMGTVKPEMIYAVIRYCVDKLKIKHMVIDSLMKCVRGDDDYDGQKQFVNTLCSLAMDLGIHIHLVHHAKKKENEDMKPGKFDAKGSGAIIDQVDQLLTVWRNKKKERDFTVAIRLPEGDNKLQKLEEIREKPDSVLICDKNRHGEWEGQIMLWRHAASLQFTGDSRREPLNMLGTLV